MTSLNLQNKKIYDILLSYILKECDEISFHFPILDEKGYNYPDLAQDMKRYDQARRELLSELFKHGATREISGYYQTLKLGYDTQIIRVKLYPDLIKMIKEHHLYDWIWTNAMPEDPCFFSGKTCRFITISHEELFYICDRKREASLIKQLNAFN